MWFVVSGFSSLSVNSSLIGLILPRAIYFDTKRDDSFRPDTYLDSLIHKQQTSAESNP